MDAARSALRCGAESVTIAYRRGRAEMPAQPEEIAAAEREGVVVRTQTAPIEVLGDRQVRALRVQDQAPTGDLEGGRPAYGPVPGSEHELAAQTILVAVGEEPDPSILPEGAGIEMSAWAGIAADRRTLATGRAGVFAGGDVVSGPKTIIDAVAAGRRAAASVHEYLAGVKDGEREIMAAVRYRTPVETHLSLDLAPRGRVHAPIPLFQPGSFEPSQGGFDEGMAGAEASRCFRCDAIYRCSSVEVVAGRGPRDAQAPVPPGLGGSIPMTTAQPGGQS
jgi:hypothetical protein